MKALYTFIVILFFQADGLKSQPTIKDHFEEEEHPALQEAEAGIDASQVWRAYHKSRAWNSRTIYAPELITNVRELGPQTVPGRVRSILVDRENDLYLVTASGGGLWRFTEDGSEWRPLNDDFPTLSITSLTQDATQPKDIYISTGDLFHFTLGAGVFKSTDGGSSFELLEATNAEDNPDFTFCRFVKAHPDRSNVVYAGCNTTSARAFVYKSIDGGSSFIKIFDKKGRIKDLGFGLDDNIVLALEGNGLYHSVDGSSGSFLPVSDGIPFEDCNYWACTNRGVGIASSKGQRNQMYAILASADSNTSRVFRSADSGVTWLEITNPDGVIFYSQGWFALDIAVSPDDPNLVATGGLNWGYSKDGGMTWVRGYKLEVDFHSFYFDEQKPGFLWVGYDQGLGSVDFNNIVSENVWTGSTTETKEIPKQVELGKIGGFNASQIYHGDYFPTGNAFVMGAQDWGIQLTYDNGLTDRDRAGDGGAAFIHRQNPDICYASTTRGRLYKSLDATTPGYYREKFKLSMGEMDLNIDGKPDEGHPFFITKFVVNQKNGDQLFYPTLENIWRSNNRGENWEPLFALGDRSIRAMDLSSATPQVLSMIYKENNAYGIIRLGGIDNNPFTEKAFPALLPGFSNYIQGHPTDPNTVFVFVTSGGVEDIVRVDLLDQASPTLRSIRGDLPEVNFRSFLAHPDDPENVLFIGTDLGLYSSINGGFNWTLEDELPFTRISDLKYRSSDQSLFVFTYGRGTFIAEVPPNNVTKTREINSAKFNIFPNPAKAHIRYESTLGFRSNLEYSVFNIEGKKLLAGKVVGRNGYIDVRSLTTGSYMIHFKNAEQLMETIQFVKE